MKKWLPAVLLVGAFVGSLYLGATQIDNFWSALINPGSNEILWQIRFPRVTAAVIVGAALAVAGLLAQGACNNAVAEPAILGTAAGASFGAVLAISAGLVQVGTIGAIACGTIGALLTTSLTFRLAAILRNDHNKIFLGGLYPVPSWKMNTSNLKDIAAL